MATEATIGLGTTFAIQRNGAGSTTTVGEITSIDGPGMSRDSIDATHLQSAGGWREKIRGLKTGDQCALDLSFIPGDTTQELLYDSFNDSHTADVDAFVVTYPDGSIDSFDGFVITISPTVPVDDRMTLNCTVEISGPIVRT